MDNGKDSFFIMVFFDRYYLHSNKKIKFANCRDIKECKNRKCLIKESRIYLALSAQVIFGQFLRCKRDKLLKNQCFNATLMEERVTFVRFGRNRVYRQEGHSQK